MVFSLCSNLRQFDSIVPDHDLIRHMEKKIAELEKSLEEERQARKSLENAVETLDDGFALFDREDRLEFVNSKLKEIYPKTADALQKGSYFKDLLRIGVERGEFAEAKGQEEEWLAERLESRRSGNRDFDQELGDGRWLKNSDRRTKDGGTVCLRVDITDLKHAELALRKQNQYLEALHQVSLGLFERTDIETLLEQIIDRAAALAGTEHGFINLFDKDTGILECKYATGRATETVGLKLKLGEGLAGKVLLEDRPIIIRDYKQWEGRLQGKIFDDMHTCIVLPLKNQAGVLGLICYNDEACDFGGFILTILSRFAELASIALHNTSLNSQLNEELRQRRESDSALRASRERYRELIKSVPNAVVVYDAQGKASLINSAFENIYGWTLEEMNSGSIKFVPESEISITRRAWERQVTEGKTNFATRRFSKNGELLEVEIHGTSLMGPEGKYEGAVILHYNVTERNRAERALQDKEKSQQTILQANPDPVVVYDKEGLVTYINPAFNKTFGWSSDELIGKKIPYVPPDERERSLDWIKWLYASGKPASFETKRLTKDGKCLDILISAARITDTDGHSTGMVVNLTDMTSLKQLESQLRQSQKMEAVGTLAGGIAHDFNNILHAISGYAQLLAPRSAQNSPQKLYSAEIQKAVERASELVRNLLTFSRKVETNLQPVDLNQEIKQAVRILERTLPRMIKIETGLQEDVWQVNADPIQIEQILLNLGLNASDAMPEGGVLSINTRNITLKEHSPSITEETPPGDYVLLSVSDNGSGISLENQKHIFDPFFTTKEVGKGTGLGLSMVYGAVQNHSGTISCESQPGKGSVFNIHLPRCAESPGQALKRLESKELVQMGTETILLVDDDESILGLGRVALEKIGYRVITACCGEDALDIYAEQGQDIDLVLLDLNMPGMGGERCLEGLRKRNPEIKVIVASGYSSESTEEHITALGASSFLAKPYRLKELAKVVREVSGLG